MKTVSGDNVFMSCVSELVLESREVCGDFNMYFSTLDIFLCELALYHDYSVNPIYDISLEEKKP